MIVLDNLEQFKVVYRDGRKWQRCVEENDLVFRLCCCGWVCDNFDSARLVRLCHKNDLLVLASNLLRYEGHGISGLGLCLEGLGCLGGGPVNLVDIAVRGGYPEDIGVLLRLTHGDNMRGS